MEQVMGNYAGARAIFERWMKWMPDEHAWNSFIKFETKVGEIDKVRDIFERCIHSKIIYFIYGSGSEL